MRYEKKEKVGSTYNGEWSMDDAGSQQESTVKADLVENCPDISESTSYEPMW